MTGRELREKRLHLRMAPTERQALRDLAAEEHRTDSELVRDLVREAVAKRREETQRRWPHLFDGDGDNPPGEAA